MLRKTLSGIFFSGIYNVLQGELHPLHPSLLSRAYRSFNIS
jgi:hypothetical protein